MCVQPCVVFALLIFPLYVQQFSSSRTGELTNRLAADTQVVQSAVTENLSMLARYTLQMFISVGLMFYINAKLTAVLLSVVPIIVVAAVQYGEWLPQCFY